MNDPERLRRRPLPGPRPTLRRRSAGPGGRGFGSNALKVDGKIFASLSHGRLLVKLPAERVKALVEAKLGEPFSTGPGRVKKEWVTHRSDER